MFLTDPSPITQIAMAIPVVGLYFLGIWGGKFVGEDRIPFRWYHVWPIVVGGVLFALLLMYADEINESLFSSEEAEPSQEAPVDPGEGDDPGYD